MPGIDPTIALGAKAPDPMQNLSGLLNVANGAQTFRQNQQKTQQGSIDLQERQGVQSVLADPSNYTDQDGNIDFNRALPAVMRVAPTTGMKYVQDLMTAQKQQVDAKQSLNNLTTDVRTQAGKVLYGIPLDAPPEVVNGTIDALSSQYKGGGTYFNTLKSGYAHALQQGKGPDFIANAAKTTMPPQTQQTMASGNLAFVGTNQGTQPFQTQVGAATPVGPVGKPMAPPNQVVQSPQNRTVIVNPGTGQSSEPQSAPNTPPVNFPPNESAETWKDFQGQRDAARQAAVSAPVMHDINRTIVAEANKGFSTGALGALTQKVASATGYQLGPNESATDYNVLGKMLERSALTAAQSMGPHTNAGLEASVRANGSLEYTPKALKKIAYLNDALTSGAELYNQGLERAISNSPNGVFAKRDFDAQWGKVATPQALRLKNAVDNGNQEEIQNILTEVGGKKSAGAQKLHQQLVQLLQLSGQQ